MGEVHVRRFGPEELLLKLNKLPETDAFWIGFSGGADSTALLVAMHELRNKLSAPIRVVHFDHGIDPHSGEWAKDCEAQCLRLGCPLEVIPLELEPGSSSPETAAREGRYAVIEKRLGPGDIYLTAHHENDNSETLLLNLLRGCGLDGLAAIPELRVWGRGWVARPLLDFPRQSLCQYLQRKHIDWLEDPSNRNLNMDRNYLRHELLPLLEKRWPGASQRLSHSAQGTRAVVNTLRELISIQHQDLFTGPLQLAIDPLRSTHRPLQALILRQWIRDSDARPPPEKRLLEFLRQLNESSNESNNFEMRWSDWVIRSDGNSLWLLGKEFPLSCPTLNWSSGSEIMLDDTFGRLTFVCETGPSEELSPASGWILGPRMPGSKLQLTKGGPHRKTKELMREAGIPAWLRNAIPVLYRNNQVAAIGDWHFCPEFQEMLNQNHAEYHWQPTHPLLRVMRQKQHSI